MAIKGKSRKRSKARPPALPPRPTPGARKTPWQFRRQVKRTAVIVLAVLAFLGGLRVWQNVSRADALKTFNVNMQKAQGALIRHFAQDSPASFDKTVQAFTAGQIDGPTMIKFADLWEKDFRTSKAAVDKVKAPNKVAADAKFLIAQGIDHYVGIARLYNLAGQVKALAASEKDPKQKQALTDKVQVLMFQADEWRKQRADIIYTRGATELHELNLRYGVEKKQAPSGTSGTTQ